MTVSQSLLVAAAETPVDELSLNFNPTTVVLLNVILGLIMFGVALDITTGELRSLRNAPVAVTVGLVAQFLMLPALTFGLTQVLDPAPSIALGMILVGASPGGNMSNFITHVAKGNTLLSVGMTGASTVLAVVLTPLNFAFWGSLDEDTDALMRSVSLDPLELIGTVALLLGVPVALGMLLRAKKPDLAKRLHRPMRIASLVFFGIFLLVAFLSNVQNFVDYIGFVALAVLLHNGFALATGYAAAAALRLPERDRRAISIEVGIQNSALSLALIFGFFDGLGGMALVAAWWGIWHIVSGFTMAAFWSRRPTGEREPVPEPTG